MTNDLSASVVRILRPDGETVGTGFLVSEELVVTCAHVVVAACKVGSQVTIVFHTTSGQVAADVDPKYLQDPKDEDIAILKIRDPLPEGIKPLSLGSSAGTSGHRFKTFGFPKAKAKEGMWGYGRIGDRTTQSGHPVLQLTGASEITTGFSGAPVLDLTTKQVIGLVVSITRPDALSRQSQTAFIIASESLRAHCPSLKLSDICPYKGLAAFDEEDAPFFFGRDDEIKELTTLLRKGVRFIAILGSSGSGKSSLVRAGLLPQLTTTETSDNWVVLSTRPGSNPYSQMVQEDNADSAQSFSRVMGELSQAQLAGKRVLLYVDQFEELFTLVENADMRSRYVDDLVALLNSDLPITLLITMRSDFYPYLDAEAPALLHSLEQEQGLVNLSAHLTFRQLHAVIVEPAEQIGLRFEEGLVETILSDVTEAGTSMVMGKTAVLPLLEFALTQLWELRDEGMLTHAAYFNDIGGVKGGLSRWANEALQELRSQGYDSEYLPRRIFSDLVYIGDERQGQLDSRRPRTLTELIRSPEERASVLRVVDHLAIKRLLITEGHVDTPNQNTRVSIIHDALLLEWGKLKKWLAEDREFLLWRQRLQARQTEWEQKGQDYGGLLRDAFLAEAQRWFAERDEQLSPAEKEFIAESTQYQVREERRSRNLQRILIGSALIATSVFAILAWFGFDRSRAAIDALGESNARSTEVAVQAARAQDASTRSAVSEATAVAGATSAAVNLERAVTAVAVAEAQATVATNQANLASSRALAIASAIVGINDPTLSLQLAIEAGGIAETSEAVNALRSALTMAGIERLVLTHDEPVTYAVLNKDQSKLLTISGDNKLTIWDSQSGNKLHTLTEWADVNHVSWNPTSNLILTGTERNAAIWDGDTGEWIRALDHEGPVLEASWNQVQSLILTAGGDGLARVWEAQTGQRVLSLRHGGQVHTARWISDERRIITCCGNDAARIWDSTTGEELFSLDHSGVGRLTWLSDESVVFTAGNDGSVRGWDMASGVLLYSLPHDDVIADLILSPDEKYLLTAGFNYGTGKVWNLESQNEIFSLDHPYAIGGALWSPDGSTILTYNSEGGVVVAWDAVTGKMLYTFEHNDEWIDGAGFNQDGSQILVYGGDSMATLWDAATGDLLFSMQHGGYVPYATWNQDESQIITVSSDGSVGVWDTWTGREKPSFAHGEVVTDSRWNKSGDKVLAASRDATARVWDLASGKEVQVFQHEDKVDDAAWSPDENWILTISGTGGERVSIWDSRTAEMLFTWQLAGGVGQAVWAQGGEQIITVSGDRYLQQDVIRVQEWDARSGQLVAALIDEENPQQALLTSERATTTASPEIEQAIVSDDGRFLLVRWSDNAVDVWGVETNRKLGEFQGEEAFRDIVWNDDGSTLLYVESDFVRVVDLANESELFTLQHGTFDFLTDVRWSPDERYIATASWDKTVRIWNAKTGEEFRVLRHRDDVESLRWHPNGSMLLSGSRDGTARVWNVDTGQEVFTIRDDEIDYGIWGEWDSSGTRLFLVLSNVVQVYDTRIDELISQACSRVGRNMSQADWRLYFPDQPYRQTCPNLPPYDGRSLD